MAFSFDFFISYVEEEQAWVEQHLLPVFRAANRKCATMADLQGAQPSISGIKRFICGSQKILLVISPTYVSSQVEQVISLCRQHYGAEMQTWPVILLIVIPPAVLPVPLGTFVSLDFSHPEQIAANVSRLLDRHQLLTPLPATNQAALPDIYSPRYKKLSEYLRLLQKQHGLESMEAERFRLESLIDRVQSILRRLSY